MTRLRRPAIASVVVALLASLLVVVTPPPSAEAAAARPWPAVWDVVPATGEVVSAGTVRIAGTATAPSGVRSAEVRVDGEPVPTSIIDANDTAARVEARPRLTAGEHVVSMRFVANDGTPTERTWRISASDVGLARLQGADRYATAVAIARAGAGGQKAPAAVLARGDAHADALAGVPLAFHLGGPLLLSTPDQLTGVTAEALRDLVQAGGTVHLLGGAAALDGTVADAVRALGFRVRRHAGPTRYDTAAAVAAQLPTPTSAVVASGLSFADALAAAPAAAQQGQPVLLTAPDRLPEATRRAVQDLDQVTVVGGAAVVSPDVVRELDAAAGTVRTIAGPDRYATAVRVLRAYDLDTSAVGLASGETFPDALVGALDAAHRGTGLLLTPGHALARPTRGAVRDLAPSALRVYGGAAAVADGVAAEARAAVTDRGARLVEERPSITAELHSLDQLTLAFAGPIDLARTSISVLFDGREVPTRTGTGDFTDTLVLSVGALMTDPVPGRAHQVRVVGAVRDDSGWTHVDRSWTYRKVSMTAGDEGSRVRALQDRLVSLGYWLGTPDGQFGSLTTQAVMAFQKYERLPITGTADGTTLARLEVARRPVPADTSAGTHVEIDKSRQIMLFADGGTTRWTMNVSTGSEVPYEEEGGSGTAITPTGTFNVCHERDYLRESSLGTLWRPKYFHCGRGIAVHGATSVPGYPASHGCVRVTYAAMNFIWAQDLMPMGTRVLVHGSIPGA